MKYTTIVSESWWYIDDGETDREIHDDMMMLYLFHVGAKWWCHFIVIQSVKKTSTWHDMHKNKQTKRYTILFKKNVGLEFKLILWLRIPVHNKRCTWDPDSEKPMHLGVPVSTDASGSCGSEKPMRLRVPVHKNWCTWGFLFGGVPVRKNQCT